MEGLAGEDISPLNSLAYIGGVWKSRGQRSPARRGCLPAQSGSAVVFFTSSITA